MKRILMGAAALAALVPALPAAAQEIVVTASRRIDMTMIPVVRMKRTADFAILEVVVTGDTRDATRRQEEIYGMVRKAIDLAPRYGVELATGELIVEPLTPENYRDLGLEEGDREDTDEARFYVKARLEPGMASADALGRITRFVEAVPPVGRAQMEADGDLALSVVDPDQYRGQIVALIAEDAGATAAAFGPGYGVRVSQLEQPVRWVRASLTEVYLYLPVDVAVVPRSE
ncbi:TonB-dependent receptor [Sphingosinithalassobacter tenebrarum]|uniref:TonB-dependent receptor n=2 Tax=Stakelama tenebrarum TaxID=2711215 RepID=A0A6G6Y6K1_9SPHN|nr:TonB-dependent receptor [Sphingosinithalassobacter tenebrarum]